MAICVVNLSGMEKCWINIRDVNCTQGWHRVCTPVSARCDKSWSPGFK
uniref:Uncharacterized protein n=1 Tax=Anguilla anguilla TaxID=7936 RepID=A0A0E9R2D3_ANGAN